MQFSIARLLLITLFVNLIVAATFAFPAVVGISVLTFVAMFVVPPFIVVGAFNTRGLRQAFFLGTMVSGTAHFVINIYVVFLLIASLAGDGFSSSDLEDAGFRYLNGIMFLLGAIGGLSGMAAYYFLKLDERQENGQESVNKTSDDITSQQEILGRHREPVMLEKSVPLSPK